MKALAAAVAVGASLALGACGGGEDPPPQRGERVVADLQGGPDERTVRVDLGREQSAALVRERGSSTGRAVPVQDADAERLFAALDRGIEDPGPCARAAVPAPDEIDVRLRYAGRDLRCPYSDLRQPDLRIAVGLLLDLAQRA